MYDVWKFGSAHFGDSHKELGLAVVVATFVQVFIGAMRPHTPERGQPPSSRRAQWFFLHRVFGAFVLVGALINVLLAADEYLGIAGGVTGSSYFPGGSQSSNMTLESVIYAFGAVPLIILIPLWYVYSMRRSHYDSDYHEIPDQLPGDQITGTVKPE